MSQPLCILIHGFTGSPWEVTPLADALSESGYDVMMPLLPGHHHSGKRMDKVQSSNWIYAIEELIETAMHENRTIHIIGFSMGALIAVIVAYRYAIRTVVLLSPAVYTITPNVLMIRSKRILNLLRENRPLFKDTLRNHIRSLRSAPLYNIVQFQKVVRDAKKVVPYLTVPVCVIHGIKDELVDPKSSEWIYKTISSQEKELYLLSHSGHGLCHDIEAPRLVQKVIHFLKKHR